MVEYLLYPCSFIILIIYLGICYNKFTDFSFFIFFYSSDSYNFLLMLLSTQIIQFFVFLKFYNYLLGFLSLQIEKCRQSALTKILILLLYHHYKNKEPLKTKSWVNVLENESMILHFSKFKLFRFV